VMFGSENIVRRPIGAAGAARTDRRAGALAAEGDVDLGDFRSEKSFRRIKLAAPLKEIAWPRKRKGDGSRAQGL